MKMRLLFNVLSALVLFYPRAASAQAAGDGGTDAGCVDYAGNPCPPLACEGALCDTTNGSGCSAAGGSPTLLLTVVGAAALAIARRRRRAAEQAR